MRLASIIVLALAGSVLTSLLAAPAFGQEAYRDAYRWVDEDGNVHYGDRPPEDVEPESVDLSDTEISAKRRAEAQQVADKRRALAGQIEQPAAGPTPDQEYARNEARVRRVECDRARHRLHVYDDGRPTIDVGDDGEPAYLDDATRQRRLQSLRAEVARLCG